jgi:hypothetical protein
MRKLLLILICAILPAISGGCKKAPTKTDILLDQAGLPYERIQELRDLKVSDMEVEEVVKIRQEGISDATAVALVREAHSRVHPFSSGNAVINLSHAGFSESDILELASTDRLETLSLDAVTLRLTGLSSTIVIRVLHRTAQGLPTLSGPIIGELKNTGLSDQQILDRINGGMTDAAAAREVAQRKRSRNKTGFVRNSGRRR